MKNLSLHKQQLVLYCVIGFSGGGLDFCFYSLLVVTKLLDYQAANAIGYASGTLLSFILNAKFNFRVTDRIALRLLSFFGVAALGYLASRGLLGWLIGDCGFGNEGIMREAEARGFTMVLPRTQVILFDDKMNITKDVVVAMDKKVPHVEFPAPKLEMEAAPAAGQSGAAKKKSQ